MTGSFRNIKREFGLPLLLTVLALFSRGMAVAQMPVAAFSSDKISGCSPLVVHFKDESTGNPVFWNWDLGNGQLSNLQNPTGVYNTPGTYSVTLVVRNADGTNGITKTNYITVEASPKANFSANKTITCLPATIQFTDLSTAQGSPITDWFWDFGDGTTSTQQNPSKTYANTGFYSVTLRVTSSSGCVGATTKGQYIRVVSGIIADFDFSGPVTCRPPYAVSFNNQTSGPGTLTYQWDFGNSSSSTQANPTGTYAATGNYTVKLTATSQYGCASSIQKPISISGNSTSFTIADSLCLNVPVRFMNNAGSPPVSTVWDFGNGKKSVNINDTSSYASPGNYTVKLINTYATCTDSSIRTITVSPLPTVNFSAPAVLGCKAPFTVDFSDISPDASTRLWDFGDGGTASTQNPSHTYTTAGTYDVTLSITSSKGCSNSLTRPAYVQIVPPTLGINGAPTGLCQGQNFSPIANATAIDGVASYFWDFGDGFTSTAQNPGSHSYAATGNYKLTLVITTNGGCSDTATRTIKVGTPVSPVDFSASVAASCASDSVSFTNLSGNVNYEFLWNFGDGGTSTDENPSHLFQDSGYFNVSLSVINNGCPTTVIKPNLVRILPPIARFTNIVSCNNKRQVNFVDLSKTDASMPGGISYAWDFGDGNTDNTANPSHLYNSLGNYRVKLTVTNGGCTHSFDSTIRLVGELADFTLSQTQVCRNSNIIFNAVNSNPANVVQYEWFQNGVRFASETDPKTNHVFNVPGAYTITLVITDINGCTDTATKSNILRVDGPVARFTTVRNACRNDIVSFADSSTGNITSYTWDFGDGTVQTLTAPFTHQYTDTGYYSVKLTVMDASGCQHSYIYPRRILISRPVARFEADLQKICPGTNITFSNMSEGIKLRSLWSFGDGQTDTSFNTQHIYTGADSVYTVKLALVDSLGCRDSLVMTNYITSKTPKAAFSLMDTSSVCILLETKFLFQGENYESFYWDFGDGATSTLQDPHHFYNNFGSYNPKLYVRGFGGGCIDSASAIVNVYNPFAATQFTYSPVTACNSLNVDFSITPPPGTNFTFNSADGFVDTSQTRNFSHLYKSFGYYGPFLIIRDSVGCRATVGGGQTIRILGAEPLFGLSKKAFCDSGNVLFANYTIANDPIISTIWDFGDGSNSSVKNPSHAYNQAGTYIVALTANTQSGCTKTLTDTVRIYATPSPVILGDTVVCINDPLPLQGVSQPADTSITWSWNFGNGQTSADQNPGTSYSTAGNYTISLDAKNKLGCGASASMNVLVPPTPAINILDNPSILVGTGINLPVSYGPGIATYTWTPSTRLSCTDCPVPYADPRFTTRYRITVADIYGCDNSAELTVTVTCNDKNFFIPNTFSPNNDGHNDVFYPRANGVARVQSLRIYNRWGEMVFNRSNFMANDASAGWNGQYKNRPAEPGVYVYVIEVICENGEIIPSKGNVALIR